MNHNKYLRRTPKKKLMVTNILSKMLNMTSHITVKQVKIVLLVTTVLTVLQLFGLFTHLYEKDYYEDFHYPYDGDITIFIQQLRENERPDIPPINYYNQTFLKDIKGKCGNEMVRLVYLVKSALHNTKRRLAIRNSWGFERRFSDVEVRTVFLLGNSDSDILQQLIDEESSKYGDIVQGDFLDTYFNNTIKTMLGFKWAVTFCPNSQFYMFVDDDYYVSTRNLLKFIRHPTGYPQYLSANKAPTHLKVSLDAFHYELPSDIRLYAGFTFTSSPHRHITSKWHVSFDEYPYHMWPPYVTAGAYVLSREALFDMYYASFYTKHFRFDDIYVALLAKKSNIEPYHCNEFYYYKKPYQKYSYNNTIASHGYDDPTELLHIWNEQKILGNA